MKAIKFKKIINIVVCILVVFSIFMAIFVLKTLKTKTPDNPIADNAIQSVIQNISQSKRGSSTENNAENNKIQNEKTTEPTENREENSNKNTNDTSYEIPPNIQVDYIILPKGNVVAVDNNHEASNVPGNNRNPNNYNSNALNSNSNGGGNTSASQSTQPMSSNPITEPPEPTVPVDFEDMPSFETDIENNAELNSKDYSFEIKHLNDSFTPVKTFVYVNDALVPQFKGNILLDYGKNTVKIIVSYKDKNGKIINVFKGYTLFVKSPEIKINTDLKNKTVNTAKLSFTASAWSDISVSLKVTLNGEAVSGDTSYNVTLKEGDNAIKLTAKAYGKEREENYTVTYVKPEKAVLRTNLNNNETVNTAYINFEAYIDGGSNKAKLEVRINDNLITGNDDNYTANLQMGSNTIRFTVMDGGTKERYIYNVNYRPVTTPETEPYITYINFTDGMNLKGSQFRLIVTAADYKGNKIYAGTDANSGMTVTLNNGGILIPSGTDEYFLYLQSGKNTITIKLIDEIGYTAIYEYTIYCQKVNKGDPIGTVTISLDAKTLGLDYIIEPDTVTIYEGKSIAETLVEFIENYGIDCEYSNTYDTGFYLQRIHQANIARWAEIPQELVNELNNDGITWTDSKIDSIGEQDFTRSSGWMYNINGIYVNHGFSDCILKDGDVVELRYTLALGKDIGAAKSTGESGGNYSKVW